MFHHNVERKKGFLEFKKQQLNIVEKIGTFPKGLVHALGQKLAIFPSY